MKELELFNYIDGIEHLDREAMKIAQARQDDLAKPPGSLGKLEEISIRLAGITGEVINSVDKPCVVVCCADNGVVEEGVSSAPQSVTRAQTINFIRRKTGVGALAKVFNSQLCVVDVGINGEIPSEIKSEDMADFEKNKVIDRKISYGTKNLAKEAAMTRKEVVSAIQIGIEAAETVISKGYNILGVGEMGIGNTTTSAALLTSLTNCPVEVSVGRGGGITDTSFEIKKEIVSRVGSVEYKDLIDTLANIGGLDICTMVGVYLGAAKNRVPVVVDGYISSIAALVASRFSPTSRDYFFGSHVSEEKGYGVAMKSMGIPYMLDLNMRLGEGSGCVIGFKVIEAAAGVMKEMATFAEAEINDDYLEEIRKGDCF